MATSMFHAGPTAFLAPRADHYFGGFTASHSHILTHESHSSGSAFPSAPTAARFGAKQLLPPISTSKLPSLEGLLKKMQFEAPTSPLSSSRAQYSPAAQSLADFSERAYAQDHRLSPAGRTMAPMPALRTIISPSMTKSTTAAPAYSGVQQSVHSASFQLGAQQQQHGHMAFPSRKRSWVETTSAAQTAFYPIKERAVCPVSPSSSADSVAPSSGPHRSRASKYCKIEGCERVSQRNNLCHSHGGKRLCKEDGCSSKDRGNGYCIKHGGGKICSMESCEKKARRKGLCTQHFRVSDDESPESMDSHHHYDSSI
ncbi:hypothetical protein PybrP1_012581 [[Pythium] brassicae (nom. inval.)]|nr:hypothetical protein PybrP1_012581 [[Pythium] brassicae (nom. inval.)]